MHIAFFILGSLICAGFVYLATRETAPSKKTDAEAQPRAT